MGRSFHYRCRPLCGCNCRFGRFYTARLAKRTTKLSESAEKEANAVVAQGAAIEAQARAVTAQAASASEQVAAVTAQAGAATEQAELTRQTLAASVQPLLTLGEPGPNQSAAFVVIPVGAREQNPKGCLYVQVVVRNVGSGVAIIDPKHSHVVGWPSDKSHDAEPQNYSSGNVEDPILPAGEQTTLTFTVDYAGWLIDYETLTGQHRNDGEFWVDVAYGDALGFDPTAAHLHAALSKSANVRSWSVFEIDYFSPPNAEDPRMTVRL
jgi:hypothetical protein